MATCKSCGIEIYWERENGIWRPRDSHGELHYASSCEEWTPEKIAAAERRMNRPTGRRIDEPFMGYIIEDHTTIGRQYTDTPDNGIPPWGD